MATPSSVVPAFVRKGDVLFYDSSIHFTLATGIKLSRGEKQAFPHNDAAALGRMLETQAAADSQLPPLNLP